MAPYSSIVVGNTLKKMKVNRTMRKKQCMKKELPFFAIKGKKGKIKFFFFSGKKSNCKDIAKTIISFYRVSMNKWDKQVWKNGRKFQFQFQYILFHNLVSYLLFDIVYYPKTFHFTFSSAFSSLKITEI